MDIQQIFGGMTMFFGVMMAVFGLSAQAIKNYREKRCGNPLLLVFLSSALYFSRAGYAFTIDSSYIMIPDAIGVAVSILILFQHRMYKNTAVDNK